MILAVGAVTVGLALGIARGGRLGNLGDAPIQRGWLLGIGLLLQIAVAFAPPGGPGLAALLLSSAALLAFLWANRVLPGMSLALVGLLLNAVVIAANGGMPVSSDALRSVDADAFVRSTASHRPLLEGDRLWFLADVIPIPLLRTVVSVGDVVLAAGLGVLVHHLSRGATRRRRPD